MIYFDRTARFVEIQPGLVVHAFNILTTKTWVAELLQHSPRMVHSSLSSIRQDTQGEGVETITEHGYYGEYSTMPLPAHIEALKGEKRYTACKEWRRTVELFAHQTIKAALPEFSDARAYMGRLEKEFAPDHCSCGEERIFPQPCPLHG